MNRYQQITPHTDVDALRRRYVDDMNSRIEAAQGEDTSTPRRRPAFRRIYSGPGYPVRARKTSPHGH